MTSREGVPASLLGRLTWLKHASFLYDGSFRIAFDPWEVSLDRPVDLVLITHGHYDHCDPETVNRITKETATVIAAGTGASKLPGDIHSLKPGEVFHLPVRDHLPGGSGGVGVTVTATEAYNLNKPYHPRGEGVGFLVAVDGGTIFHAGDTDDIPETHNLKPDVALLPVGGTYTMDVTEAARAAAVIGAAVTVPMHYGFIVGSPQDGGRFQEMLGEGARVLAPVVPFVRTKRAVS